MAPNDKWIELEGGTWVQVSSVDRFFVERLADGRWYLRAEFWGFNLKVDHDGVTKEQVIFNVSAPSHDTHQGAASALRRLMKTWELAL